MKNPFKKGTKLATVTSKVISHVMGDFHFLFKTSADITARAESKIVNKLTGRAPSSVIEDRHNRTEATQTMIIDKSKQLGKTLTSFFHAVDDAAVDAVQQTEFNN